MKVVAEGRYPWIVRVGRSGEKISVSRQEDIPKDKTYATSYGTVELPWMVGRMEKEEIVSLKKADKTIARKQRECDALNEAENRAQIYLHDLQLRAAGPE